MIQVWRLCQSAYRESAFSGDGARRYGGRWNLKGQQAIYTAATQSLAALEILVHVDTDLAPNDFVAFAVDIPDASLIATLDPRVLPRGWRSEYPPLTCQRHGGAWLTDQRSAVLAVPSAVIPEETNYILNPQHHDFGNLTVHPGKPFAFDERLWRR